MEKGGQGGWGFNSSIGREETEKRGDSGRVEGEVEIQEKKREGIKESGKGGGKGQVLSLDEILRSQEQVPHVC